MILFSIWGILSERPLISKTAGNYKSMEGKEFIIKKYYCADPGVISDVKSFTQECTRIEGIKAEILPEASMNFKDGMPCLFTCELNGKRIGVLNIFAPGPFETEIGALVHPDYRRRGVFKALLREALGEISRYGYRRGLFVCDVSFDSGTNIAEKLRLKRDHGEFHMLRDIGELKINERLSDIIIAEAGENELDELTELGTEVFDIDEISERQLLLRTLESPDRVQLAVKKGDKIIGLCGIRIKNGECMVFGLGIHPEERHKGYANGLLAFIAGYAGKKGAETLSLDVDSENIAAISLYESFGLKRAFETDYYIFTFRGVKRFLRPRRSFKK